MSADFLDRKSQTWYRTIRLHAAGHYYERAAAAPPDAPGTIARGRTDHRPAGRVRAPAGPVLRRPARPGLAEPLRPGRVVSRAGFSVLLLQRPESRGAPADAGSLFPRPGATTRPNRPGTPGLVLAGNHPGELRQRGGNARGALSRRRAMGLLRRDEKNQDGRLPLQPALHNPCGAWALAKWQSRPGSNQGYTRADASWRRKPLGPFEIRQNWPPRNQPKV
jgi:hypothetical protein